MLRFFTELAGPIFAKEMVEVSRRKRYYVNRVLYGTALLIAVMVVWSESGVRFLQTSDGQLQRMARFAQEIFVAVGVVQYGAIFLLVPLFVAGLIAGERETRSLELLFTTALRDREIVLGKLASRLAIMTLLVLCGVPVMNLILLFGGVDPAAVIRTEAATLLGMLYAGSMTIYFSAISQSATTALVRSFWWMAVWMLALPLLDILMVSMFGILPRTPAAVIVYALVFINPLSLFIVALLPEAHAEVARHFGEWFFPLAFIPTGLWCAFLLWRSTARLRLQPTAFARLAANWRPLAALAGAWRRGNESIDRRRRQRAERIWPGLPVRNPLWLRARWTPIYDRQRHIGRVQWLGWLVAIGLLLLMGFAEAHRWNGAEITSLATWLLASILLAVLTWMLIRRRTSITAAPGIALLVFLAVLATPSLLLRQRIWRDEEVVLAFVIPAWIAAWLLTVILAANSLVGDRRRGFFELVLVSPLEPREIVAGTLLAVAQHLAPVYALVGALVGWFTLAGAISIVTAIQVLVTGSLFGWLLLELGVTCSLAAETPPAALIPTFVFGVVMCAGLMVLAVILREDVIPVLIAAGTLGLAACWIWAHRRESPAAIGALFLCIHLMLVLAAAALNFVYGPERSQANLFWESFIGATDPLILIYYHVNWREAVWVGYGPLLIPCYWLALVINGLLAWRWMIRHFDRLAGRANRRYPPPIAPRPAVLPPAHGQFLPQGAAPAAGTAATLFNEPTINEPPRNDA